MRSRPWTRSLLRHVTLLGGTLAATLAFCPPGAEAKVVTVGTASVGLQPREEARYWVGGVKLNGLGEGKGEANASIGSFSNNPATPTHPGPVLHSLATYAIYWDPQDYYHGDWQGLIDGYLAGAAANGGQTGNVFAVDTQYTDRTDKPATSRSSFRGAYTDTNPYPANGCSDPHAWTEGVPLVEGTRTTVCLTDDQLREQLEKFVGEEHHLQTGMSMLFYLLTPPGVTICLDSGGPTGHCSDFNGTSNEISTYEEEKATYPERVAKYQEEQKAYEKALESYKKEPGEVKPVAPTSPTAPVLPAGYAGYQQSFCSYHSAINPDGASEGDSKVILYAALPWTAGGAGDYHFAAEDRQQGVACQDGGFQPGTKPFGELEEKEREKPRTPQEEEEFEKKSKKEQQEAEEARVLGLGKPHDEEPNQLGSQRSPDGYWDEGLADLIVGQIGIEQQDTVTDPLLNGWHDSAGNEVTDECRNSFFTAGGSAEANLFTLAGTLSNQSFGGRSYYLNDAYNLAARRLPYPGATCLDGISLDPKFTAPSPVNAGETVAFDGMESDITLDAAVSYGPNEEVESNYATYTWDFGDGSTPVTGYAPGASSQQTPAGSPCAQPWLSPCAATVFHSYQYGGTYDVTLTVTDVGGNSTSFTQPISVIGPARPSSAPVGGTGGTGSSGGSGGASAPAGAALGGAPGPAGGGSPGGAGGGTSTLGIPTLGQSVLSRSLKKATSLGLAVHYVVDQQVAGQVEVLLASSTAAKLGIKARSAFGLPRGYPRSVVVGHAVLVTTRGGQGTVRIRFAKAIARKLAKAHRLLLTLRYVLRSATRPPHTMTQLSTVVLSK